MGNETFALSLDVLDAAANGQRDAVQAVIDHYSDEINALCMKTTRRRDGTSVSHIDEDMRHGIIMRLKADMPKIAAKAHEQYEAAASEKEISEE